MNQLHDGRECSFLTYSLYSWVDKSDKQWISRYTQLSWNIPYFLPLSWAADRVNWQPSSPASAPSQHQRTCSDVQCSLQTEETISRSSAQCVVCRDQYMRDTLCSDHHRVQDKHPATWNMIDIGHTSGKICPSGQWQWYLKCKERL